LFSKKMEILRNLCIESFGGGSGSGSGFDVSSGWLDLERRLLASDVLISSRREKSSGPRRRGGLRVPRNPDICCKGLVALMETDASGDWTPKRCSRGCLDGSEYCKTHGRDVSQQVCDECTDHHGHEIRHTILHEHFGVVGAPSFHFEKFRSKMIRNTLKDKVKSTDSQDKPGKKTKKVRKVREGVVLPNAFMCWLKDHRAAIKAEIQSKNPTMSARDLMVSTTKRAGELWKLLPKVDQDVWKSGSQQQQQQPGGGGGADILEIIPASQSQQLDTETETETLRLSQSDVQTSDETPSSMALSVEDDDSVCLSFHETHKVWVEEETGLYYKENNPDQAPMGQIVGGKLVPFKKNSKRVSAVESK